MSAVVALRDPVASVTAKLPPSRARLAELNLNVEAAGAEAARLAEPAEKAVAIKGLIDAAQRKCDELQAADHIALGEYLTGEGTGPRPEPSPELLATEQRMIALRRDLAALAVVQPNLERVAVEAAYRLQAAAAERDTAFYAAVAESAAAYLDEVLTPRLAALLAAEVVIRTLIDNLRMRNGHSNSAAHAAADQLERALINAKRLGVAARTWRRAGDFSSADVRSDRGI